MFRWLRFSQPVSSVSRVEHAEVALPKLQQVLVRRVGERDPVRVLAHRMSSRRIWFRGSGLVEGEDVTVSLLMNYKTLLVPATVCADQQLELHLMPHEEAEVAAYIALLLARAA